MKNALIIFLLIALIIEMIRVISLKKEVKNINKTLKFIKENNTNKRITSISMDKDLGELIKEVNFILDKQMRAEIYYEKNNKKTREMITNISHDLRTPLTSIKGYIQYVNSKSMDEEENKKYLNIVNEKAIILQELLESFFELSKIEEKKYPIELKEINLYKSLTDVVLTFYEDFKLKGIEPDINISSDSLVVLADEKAIKRVFVNLIQNILRYGEEEVKINLYEKDGSIMVQFKNKTSSLDEENINLLYDRFFTVDKTRSNGCNGIGLTIAKNLVEQMNGKIEMNLEDNVLSIEIIFENLSK